MEQHTLDLALGEAEAFCYITDGINGKIFGRLQLPLDAFNKIELGSRLRKLLAERLLLFVEQNGYDACGVILGEKRGDAVDGKSCVTQKAKRKLSITCGLSGDQSRLALY